MFLIVCSVLPCFVDIFYAAVSVVRPWILKNRASPIYVVNYPRNLPITLSQMITPIASILCLQLYFYIVCSSLYTTISCVITITMLLMLHLLYSSTSYVGPLCSSIMSKHCTSQSSHCSIFI